MRVLNLVLTVLFQSVRALGRSRSDLILENMALRQQIAVLTRMKHGARFRASDRLVWVSLRRSWRRWQNALVIVKPETVVAWHRKAFRRYWTSHTTRRRPTWCSTEMRSSQARSWRPCEPWASSPDAPHTAAPGRMALQSAVSAAAGGSSWIGWAGSTTATSGEPRRSRTVCLSPRLANGTWLWGRAKTPCRYWLHPAGRGFSCAELRRPEPASGEVSIDFASPPGQRRTPGEYWRRTARLGDCARRSQAIGFVRRARRVVVRHEPKRTFMISGATPP